MGLNSGVKPHLKKEISPDAFTTTTLADLTALPAPVAVHHAMDDKKALEKCDVCCAMGRCPTRKSAPMIEGVSVVDIMHKLYIVPYTATGRHTLHSFAVGLVKAQLNCLIDWQAHMTACHKHAMGEDLDDFWNSMDNGEASKRETPRLKSRGQSLVMMGGTLVLVADKLNTPLEKRKTQTERRDVKEGDEHKEPPYSPTELVAMLFDAPEMEDDGEDTLLAEQLALVDSPAQVSVNTDSLIEATRRLYRDYRLKSEAELRSVALEPKRVVGRRSTRAVFLIAMALLLADPAWISRYVPSMRVGNRVLPLRVIVDIATGIPPVEITAALEEGGGLQAVERKCYLNVATELAEADTKLPWWVKTLEPEVQPEHKMVACLVCPDSDLILILALFLQRWVPERQASPDAKWRGKELGAPRPPRYSMYLKLAKGVYFSPGVFTRKIMGYGLRNGRVPRLNDAEGVLKLIMVAVAFISLGTDYFPKEKTQLILAKVGAKSTIDAIVPLLESGEHTRELLRKFRENLDARNYDFEMCIRLLTKQLKRVYSARIVPAEERKTAKCLPVPQLIQAMAKKKHKTMRFPTIEQVREAVPYLVWNLKYWANVVEY